MTLLATTSASLPLPASVARTNATPLAVTPLSALFAHVLGANLQTGTPLPEDPAPLSTTEDNIPVIASTSAEPEQDTAAPEDTPWPPEGLACLWLPTSPGVPPPLPANVSAATVIASVEEMDAPPLATTPQVPLETTSPLQSSELSAQNTKPDFPISSPVPALHTSPDPAPESIPHPTSPEPESAPLSHLWESGRGEGVSVATTSPIIIPSFVPHSSISQSHPVPTPATAPFPSPDLSADNFAETLGPHIQWLAEHKIGHAHLQLNPQDMGPLEVRLKLEGDQLLAHFTSAEPDVRQALEHGLPRLRELLGEHGLHLSEGHVGQQQAQHHSASSSHDEAHPESETISDTSPLPSPTAIVHTTHLLDAYV